MPQPSPRPSSLPGLPVLLLRRDPARTRALAEATAVLRRGHRALTAAPPCPLESLTSTTSSRCLNWSPTPPGTTPAPSFRRRPPQRTSPNSSPSSPLRPSRLLLSVHGEPLVSLPYPRPPPVPYLATPARSEATAAAGFVLAMAWGIALDPQWHHEMRGLPSFIPVVSTPFPVPKTPTPASLRRDSGEPAISS